MCYDDTPVHTEQYKGFTIEVYQDTGVKCPFDDWDGEPPLAVYSGA